MADERTEKQKVQEITDKLEEDYRGHSLSVSDIVVLHQNGENSAQFVDSFVFTGLPDFIQTLEGLKEQEAEIDICVLECVLTKQHYCISC